MNYPVRTLPAVAGTPVIERSFVRGFVASACLSAIQGGQRSPSSAEVRRVLRYALQGGTALAAGAGAAAAIERRDYTGALVAAAVGAAGVFVIERMLRDAAQRSQEKHDGQEA
ncbi:hypothetical protein [Pseudothauera rhizosphaerae]|uniref:Uncharacterized protein n=1 Tax=Pseudothauera rhizosphaerae TaxID=2565932 RepID=A0A4S4ATK2_9RHOO|nr:hypothetical protein [Pseudothauera rhizosphaerae]THF63259.1 hypothetical protein E6O51_04105 [Pseudothauera rhizosphaerae]